MTRDGSDDGDTPADARFEQMDWLPRERLRWTERVAWILPLLAALGMTPAWLEPSWTPFAALAAFFALLLMPSAFSLPGLGYLLRVRERQGRAAVESDGTLVVRRGERTRRFGADRLGMAWLRTPRCLEVLLQDGELTLELASEADAEALLAEVRAAIGGRRAYPIALEGPGLQLMRRAGTAWTALPLANFALFAGPAVGLPIWAAALGMTGLIARGHPRLRFGADGLVVEGRFRRRYVPYRSIRAASTEKTAFGRHALVLTLEDGRRLGLGRWHEHSRAWLLAALVDEGVAMVERGEEAGAHVAELGREGDDSEGWKARVAAAARRGGYRGPVLDPDRLWALVRNPAAEAEQRVGAALALRASPNGIARIRVAAEVSTEPGVRDALEELAAEELDDGRLDALVRRLGPPGG